MVRVSTSSAAETERVGRWLGERLRPGDFIALVGDLGAGKTQLSGGILAGLDVVRTGGSPTFTLLWEYAGRYPVYHWDVYRLSSAAELADLGYEEYFYGSGINVVEWADRIQHLWPEPYLKIELAGGQSDTDRVLTFTGSARFASLLEDLAHANFSA